VDANRYQQVKAIVMDGIEVPAVERDRFLAERCGDDVDLRAEVESLLAQAVRDDFLASPVGGAVAAHVGSQLRFVKGPPALLDRVVPLAPGTNRVGRAEDCDIQLDFPSISRHHATLSPAVEGGWLLEDAGSRNGTRAAGATVVRARVTDGDQIGFGGRIVAVIEPNRTRR
jgi:hypothetical protein